jgi:hypothetical protein
MQGDDNRYGRCHYKRIPGRDIMVISLGTNGHRRCPFFLPENLNTVTIESNMLYPDSNWLTIDEAGQAQAVRDMG